MSAIIAFFLSPVGRLIGVGALCLIIGGIGAGWAVAKIKDAEISDIRAADAKADAERSAAVLKKLNEQIDVMHQATAGLAITQGNLDIAIRGLQDDFGKIRVAAPLPKSCRPDAPRVRVLSGAVAAANSAAAGLSPSPTVPPANRPH